MCVVFRPKWAAYLNLIEPHWKTPRSLALARRFFRTWDEIASPVSRAGDYRNARRHPCVWGRHGRRRATRKPGVAGPSGAAAVPGPCWRCRAEKRVDPLYLA